MHGHSAQLFARVRSARSTSEDGCLAGADVAGANYIGVKTRYGLAMTCGRTFLSTGNPALIVSLWASAVRLIQDLLGEIIATHYYPRAGATGGCKY
jgi:hypothetical protein